MSPRRRARAMVLGVLCAHLMGCSTFMEPEAPVPASPAMADSTLVLRGTTRDGGTLDLHSVWMDSTAVRGILVSDWGYPTPVEIPGEDVEKVEQERRDVGKTMLGAGAGVGFLSLVGYIAAAIAVTVIISALGGV